MSSLVNGLAVGGVENVFVTPVALSGHLRTSTQKHANIPQAASALSSSTHLLLPLGGAAACLAMVGTKKKVHLKGNSCAAHARHVAAKASTETTPPPPPPFNPAEQVGAMAPLGFFDPAGFSKVGDEDGFRNLRVAEIKHGRVAMMAALGGVIQHYIKLPGFEKVPAGLAAVTTAPGTYGFAVLFLLAGVLELGVWTENPEKEPGNFGDPLGLGMYDEEMRNKELNNGRFAMFAALGIVAADALTGKDAIQQFGLTAVSKVMVPSVRGNASVLAGHSFPQTHAPKCGSAIPRCFFGQGTAPQPVEPKSYKDFEDPWLGSADLGFDPLNVAIGSVFDKGTAVVPETTYYNYRESEVKHGRFAMTAFLAIFGEEADRGALLKQLGVAGAQDNLDGTLGLDEVQTPLLLVGLGLQAFAEYSLQSKEDDGSFLSVEYNKFRCPGDLGFDPLGFGAGNTIQQRVELHNVEVNLGRLAMIGVTAWLLKEFIAKDL